MFVLDAKVLSALILARPIAEVIRWARPIPTTSLYTTTISMAEIYAGLDVLPEGQRRQVLTASAGTMFGKDFDKRILPFDASAAIAYAFLFAKRRKMGRPASTPDLMIAAVASSQGAAVVTRNRSDFEGCDIEVIDPWSISR